ncbi:MAG TPA: rubrerythrin, partial [Thermopetrobacter sp.]|nr:rubrerythrin [Thermopetrobacter sp.]
LAIASEEDDARIYMTFASRLQENFPHSARVFMDMAREELQHRKALEELYRRKFGDIIPLIRREDVVGFVEHDPVWLLEELDIDRARRRAEVMELENYRFYRAAAERAGDPEVKKLLEQLADAERHHESLAARLGAEHLDADARLEEEQARRRLFALQVVQPALMGLMDGAVSSVAPVFAAAFATRDSWDTFLVGAAMAVGSGISMGIAEAMSDDGELTGRGHPLVRGLASGVMTTLGGMAYALPFLIPDFDTALAIAIAIVVLQLLAISWIRWRFMETPFARAFVQIVLGGLVVFAVGMLIGSS